MQEFTKAILLKAANAALLQNTSGNLASHVADLLPRVQDSIEDPAILAEVKLELRILGLLGSSNGGYLS